MLLADITDFKYQNAHTISISMFTSCLLSFINFEIVIFHNTAHDRPSCEPNLLLSYVFFVNYKQKSGFTRRNHTHTQPHAVG